MNVSWLVAFVAGMGSLLSPCVVPLIPSYLTAMAGGNLSSAPTSRMRSRIMTNAAAFIIGFSLILVVSGMVATQLGVLLKVHQRLFAQLGGILVILLGLQVLGIINLQFFNRERRLPLRAGTAQRVVGSFVLGLVFAAGWTPCVGPVWASILIMASQKHSVGLGGLLLFDYAMGMALPLFILAAFVGHATQTVRRLQRFVPAVERVTGGLLVVLGVALVTGFYGQIPGLISQF